MGLVIRICKVYENTQEHYYMKIFITDDNFQLQQAAISNCIPYLFTCTRCNKKEFLFNHPFILFLFLLLQKKEESAYLEWLKGQKSTLPDKAEVGVELVGIFHPNQTI